MHGPCHNARGGPMVLTSHHHGFTQGQREPLIQSHGRAPERLPVGLGEGPRAGHGQSTLDSVQLTLIFWSILEVPASLKTGGSQPTRCS